MLLLLCCCCVVVVVVVVVIIVVVVIVIVVVVTVVVTVVVIVVVIVVVVTVVVIVVVMVVVIVVVIVVTVVVTVVVIVVVIVVVVTVVVIVVVMVVVIVVVIVVLSTLYVCKSTSHAHAAESKASYYPLHAEPGDVGQCNPKLSNPNPVIQGRPITTMMTLMHNMRITNRTPTSPRNPELNSFEASQNPTLKRSTSTANRRRQQITINSIIIKNQITKNTINNQLTNMTPVRKPPSGKLTRKLGRTIPKG